MLVLLTSVEAVAPRGVSDPILTQALLELQASGTPIAIVSNHTRPAWLAPLEAGGVHFATVSSRQNGQLIHTIAKNTNGETYDVLVLAATRDDVMMGKNGKAVLVAAPSSTDKTVRGLGIDICDAKGLKEVIALASGWQGHWWFSVDTPNYRVRALSDLSSKGSQPLTQVEFSRRVTSTVKGGGPRLMALLTVTSRSLLRDGVADLPDQMWGFYPSSSSTNDDSDTLSDFTHRLRSTTSRVHFAKRGSPLFIRHQASPKRSSQTSTLSRFDPASQVETLHLNPDYRNKIGGRHVFVVDDCTTYGLSFGAAAAFLRRAGAHSVTGVALGKFGNQFHHFDITINSDPFSPVGAGHYACNAVNGTPGVTNPDAQATLRNIIV